MGFKKGILILLILILILNFGFSKIWNAYVFKKPASYTYKFIDKGGGKEYTFTIQYLGRAKNGNYKFRYSVDYEANQSDVENGGIFALMIGASVNNAYFMFLPIVYSVFRQFDISVGSQMAIFGLGVLKVEGKEKVAGIDGYVVNLYDPNGEKFMSWVVNPDIPVPLKLVMHEEDTGNPNVYIVLIKHKS